MSGKNGNGLKSLYKIEVLILKMLPLCIASFCFLNTLLSYFHIDTSIFSYTAGIGVIPLGFMYISSYCFKFCAYHRIPLHYIGVNNLLCWVDLKYSIPISDLTYLCVHLMLAFICIVFILYLKFKL